MAPLPDKEYFLVAKLAFVLVKVVSSKLDLCACIFAHAPGGPIFLS